MGQWHPAPVLLPGKSHGRRSLVGCSPWRRWESDTTERLHFHFSLSCIGEGNGNPLQHRLNGHGFGWAPGVGDGQGGLACCRPCTGVGRHFLLQCIKVKSESEVAQSCPTLSDAMDCSLPGASVHGIFQARVLEWGAIAFSQKNIYFCFIDYAKAFDCVDHGYYLFEQTPQFSC